MARRVLVAGLFHETHTFLPGVTGLDRFPALSAGELLGSAGGPAQVAGALEAGRECGWEVVPGPYRMALPGARVADDVVETFWNELAILLRTDLDGIYLDLHGAMVSESFLDVEGELLQRIRRVTQVPIGGALDLHGNITDAHCIDNAVFMAYHENPHTDTKATAARAARLLDRLLTSGERAHLVRVQPPVLWPPTGTGTADDPMRALEAAARALEASHPDLLAVNVFAGFSFADLPEAGVSFLAATTGDPEATRYRLDSLSALALSLRETGYPVRTPLDEALEKAQAQPGGPTLFVEPADNIGGGAPGDTTHLLRAFHARGIRDAAVALADPEAVAALWEAPIGGRRTLALGGKSGAPGAEPFPVECEVVSKSDGWYALEDPNAHHAMYGRRQCMGASVVVRCLPSGVIVLLNSIKTPPMDLGQWTSQGIDPRRLRWIGVKAAVAHRRAYDPIAIASYTVDTPGPCEENLARLPFRRLRRPIYPLDAI